jgi:NTP pyrophosphatase (non-canonical NTP hydrolase)
MYKDLKKIEDILMYKTLEIDSVAHVNGDDLTLTIATEESAELIQALTKVKRYGFKDEYKDNLQEEIADVLICISELTSLGYIDIAEVEKWHTYKVNREIKRAKKTRNEDRR